MRRSKGRAKPNAESAKTSLRLQQPSEVLAALLRERSRLLKKIAQKRHEFEQECESIQSTVQTMLGKMQVLLAERTQLIDELRRIFDELLAEGRLSRNARKKVASVYRIIEESGDLEPLDFDPFSVCHDSNAGPDFPETEASDVERAPQPVATASARHAGGQPGNDSLRGLFRRLTMALHPDRVRHEGEQKRRTDVMKEVTRAYEEGDFARLIEIEQQWLASNHVDSAANDEAAKCAALERTILELQSQLKAVASELKAVRQSSPLRAIFGNRRANRSAAGGPMEAMLAAAEAELEPLRQILNFVRSFSERKISLAEFLHDPSFLQLDDEFDDDRIMLDSLMNEIEVESVNRGQGSRSRRKSKNSRTSDEVPF